MSSCWRYRLLLALLILPLAGWAKARLEQSQPNAGENVSTPLKQLDLWFNEEIKADNLAIAVIDSKAKKLNDAPIEIDTKDRTHIYTTLPDLPKDTYLVRYRVMSVDHLIVTGSFQFKVGADGGQQK